MKKDLIFVSIMGFKTKTFPETRDKTMLKNRLAPWFFLPTKIASLFLSSSMTSVMVECPCSVVSLFDKLEMDMVAIVQDCLSKADIPKEVWNVGTNCKVSKLSLIRDREAKAVMLDATELMRNGLIQNLGRRKILSKFKVGNASTSTILASVSKI